MTSLRALTCATALLLPGAAMAGAEVVEALYECERNVRLPVVFVTPQGEAGLAVMFIEGKLVAMRSLPVGSGVRYVAFDEQDGYRLYTKGNTALVRHLAADDMADEVTILRDCRRIDEKGR